MIRSTMILLVLLTADGPIDDPKPPSPDEQFRVLRDRYQVEFDEFVKVNDASTTPEGLAKLRAYPIPNARRNAPAFMELARKNPGTPAAEHSLLWVLTHIFGNRDCHEAQRILIRDHVRSEELGPALGFQGHYSDPFEETEAFFRAVLAQSPHRNIQGLATYWLARHLKLKAQWSRNVKSPTFQRHPPEQDYWLEPYGKDWVGRLAKLDPEALDREAEALFDRVGRFYADVPHNDKRRKPGPLGEAAVAYVHEQRDLAIGKPAPEFEGTDLDGRPFRLADVRGKVVVLDFGSHFYCGVCRDTYPHLRELTRRLEGRDFALISVNAEPEKAVGELKDAWKSEGNTWRCLFDGNWEGPIQKAWNIQRFPTIYVLDAEGVIRHKDLRGKELDEAVDKLVAEATAR